MTDNHMRLPTKARYFGNSSLTLCSPSFIGPRSTPRLRGMFEVAEMLYCSTMFFTNAVWFISRIPLSQSRSNAHTTVQYCCCCSRSAAVSKMILLKADVRSKVIVPSLNCHSQQTNTSIATNSRDMGEVQDRCSIYSRGNFGTY